MQPTVTDLELVRGLHARSAAAFSRVYDGYHAGIYNLCARMLDDREEARDVTQDVFIKAFSSPPAAEGEVKLKAWLYRVATNACFNVVRGRRPGGGLAEADDVPTAHDGYEQSQSAALIEQSLGQMNERYRAALVLKDLHGLGGDELAEVLEVSRPAADVLVHRARASFKKAFAGLAGEGVVAPADLALALPVLSVPASLQALPPLPAALAPPHAAAAPGPDPSAVVGPVGTGLLAKLASAAGTKAAIVAGGGLAVRESSHDGVAAGRTVGGAAAVLATPASHEPGDAHHGAYHGPHDAWAAHRHAVAEHIADHAHRGAHHGDAVGRSSAPHVEEASSSGDHTSSVAEPTHSTTAVVDGHLDPGDTLTSHEADGEH